MTTGMHVHCSRPCAEHGEEYAKIPLCAACHELTSCMRRTMRRFLKNNGEEVTTTTINPTSEPPKQRN